MKAFKNIVDGTESGSLNHLEEVPGQHLDLLGEGGREHESLPFVRPGHVVLHNIQPFYTIEIREEKKHKMKRSIKSERRYKDHGCSYRATE